MRHSGGDRLWHWPGACRPEASCVGPPLIQILPSSPGIMIRCSKECVLRRLWRISPQPRARAVFAVTRFSSRPFHAAWPYRRTEWNVSVTCSDYCGTHIWDRRSQRWYGPQGGLGREVAGHTFRTGSACCHPSRTQPPRGATLHPIPHPPVAEADPPRAHAARKRPRHTARRNIFAKLPGN